MHFARCGRNLARLITFSMNIRPDIVVAMKSANSLGKSAPGRDSNTAAPGLEARCFIPLSYGRAERWVNASDYLLSIGGVAEELRRMRGLLLFACHVPASATTCFRSSASA